MSHGKKLINSPSEVVYETIKGLVETYNNLQYLDGFPEVKVVLRADIPHNGEFSKVALISGGGSGHEPAHAGFVGKGMLTAAVCGDVFASPSVNAIITAIRAVAGPSGALLIVKNYTGDRLNFGLAAELAKAEGFKIEMVIVGDDCAIPPPRGIAGKRGLAGTLFVHKIAGAAAESGLPLADVASLACQVASQVSTMGVGLSPCTLPGGKPSLDRIGPHQMELGLGIHGEPGVQLAELQGAKEVIGQMLKKIFDPTLSGFSFSPGDKVALMVNSLGATPPMEVLLCTGWAKTLLQSEHGVSVARIVSGALMTSLDMAGLSLSVLRLSGQMASWLALPTDAPAWPPSAPGDTFPVKKPIPIPRDPSKDNTVVPTRPAELSPAGALLEKIIRAAAEAIISNSTLLNELDAKVGDGDCGTTLSSGASQILQDLATIYPLNSPVLVIFEIGKSVEKSMGGTSGILYNIFFRAAAAKLKEEAENGKDPSALQWSMAFSSAVNAVSSYGGAQEGFRTMLDALLPSSRALAESLKKGLSISTAMHRAVLAAKKGAESTQYMSATAGRSSYISPELLKNIQDPGAVAIYHILKSFLTVLN